MNNEPNDGVMPPIPTSFLPETGYEYHPLARRIFKYDPLGQGELPRYHRAVGTVSAVVAKVDAKNRPAPPALIVEAEELFIPPVGIKGEGLWGVNMVRANSVARAVRGGQHAAVTAVLEAEDRCAVACLLAVTELRATFKAEEVGLGLIVDAMAEVELGGGEARHVLCHPRVFRRLSLLEHKHLFVDRMEAGADDLPLRWGAIQRGTLFGIPILSSAYVPVDCVFVTGEPKRTGAMPVRQEYVWRHNPVPKKLKDGYALEGEVGVGVVDGERVAKAVFSSFTPPVPTARVQASGTIGYGDDDLDLDLELDLDFVSRDKPLRLSRVRAREQAPAPDPYADLRKNQDWVKREPAESSPMRM